MIVGRAPEPNGRIYTGSSANSEQASHPVSALDSWRGDKIVLNPSYPPTSPENFSIVNKLGRYIFSTDIRQKSFHQISAWQLFYQNEKTRFNVPAKQELDLIQWSNEFLCMIKFTGCKETEHEQIFEFDEEKNDQIQSKWQLFLWRDIAEPTLVRDVSSPIFSRCCSEKELSYLGAWVQNSFIYLLSQTCVVSIPLNEPAEKIIFLINELNESEIKLTCFHILDRRMYIGTDKGYIVDLKNVEGQWTYRRCHKIQRQENAQPEILSILTYDVNIICIDSEGYLNIFTTPSGYFSFQFSTLPKSQKFLSLYKNHVLCADERSIYIINPELQVVEKLTIPENLKLINLKNNQFIFQDRANQILHFYEYSLPNNGLMDVNRKV